MKLRALPANASLAFVRSDLFFTRASLQAHGEFASWVSKFDDMITRADGCLTQQQAFDDETLQGEVQAIYIDDQLDAMVDRVDSAAQIVTNKNRQSALYKIFFGKMTPSSLKRPILGAELEAVREWPGHLTASGFPDLEQLAAPLSALIQKGDEITASRAATASAYRDFKVTGAASKLIDDANALRSKLAGSLDAMAHTDGGILPDSFFRPAPSRATTKATPASLNAEIAQLEEQLAGLKKNRDEMVAQAADEERARLVAEQKAAEDELAAAKAAMEAASKKMEALKAKVGG
jgi:hypothetical protein